MSALVDINRRLCSFALQLVADALAFLSQALELCRDPFGFLGVSRLLDASVQLRAASIRVRPLAMGLENEQKAFRTDARRGLS
jgi:hypothetical protein